MPGACSASSFFLVVRFWVAPQAERQVLGWLEGGHIAEVLAQPGFQWCKRLRLDAKDGWSGFAMIYGIESRAAFEAYDANPVLKAKFAREREPFVHLLRIERFSGEVDFSAGGA
jgi:hypothetical protein